MPKIQIRNPQLPPSLPHLSLVLKTLRDLEKSKVWVAYQADLLGQDIAEMALRNAAFLAVSAQDESIAPETVTSIMRSFERAIDCLVET